MENNIRQKFNGQYQVDKVFIKEPRQLSKLIVSNNTTRIIIEPNLVLRGSVFECETHDLCQSAQNDFLNYCSVKTLSFADLYGGKICAALARQHPRDLFDVKILQSLSTNERKFLLSIKEGSPDWGLIPIEGLDKLPGLAWKKINVSKMDTEKHKIAIEKLEAVLQL